MDHWKSAGTIVGACSLKGREEDTRYVEGISENMTLLAIVFYISIDNKLHSRTPKTVLSY